MYGKLAHYKRYRPHIRLDFDFLVTACFIKKHEATIGQCPTCKVISEALEAVEKERKTGKVLWVLSARDGEMAIQDR